MSKSPITEAERIKELEADLETCANLLAYQSAMQERWIAALEEKDRKISHLTNWRAIIAKRCPNCD